jgi:hypothetical protein
MKTDRNKALAETLKLFLDFEGHPPSDQKEQWRNLESFITSLAESGWTRKDIHDLVSDLGKAHASSMPEECSDALDNYMTGLLGQVAPGYMVRLPGEPSDPEEHTRFVREQKWLH